MPTANGIADVESLLGTRLRDLTVRNIQQLVFYGAEEDGSLDFKRELTAGAQANYELAKDVCSFANAAGGVIVFGVDERDGRAVGLTPLNPSVGEVRDRFAQILRSHTRPTPAFDITHISDPLSGDTFLVLSIPRSSDAPHAVIRHDRTDPWLQFPIRHESSVRFMGEDEIASLYARRFESERNHLDRLRTLSLATETRPSFVSLRFTAVPTNSVRARVDRAVASRWFERAAALISDRSSSLGLAVGQDARDLRFIPGGVRIALTSGQVDLLQAGELAAQVHLDPFVAQAQARSAQRPAGVLDETILGLVGLFTGMAAQHAGQNVGCVGDIYARVELSARTPDGGPRRLAFVEAGSYASAGYWAATGNTAESAIVDTSFKIEAVWPFRRGLPLVLHEITSTIAQHFGLPEAAHLTATGAIRLTEFSAAMKDGVRDWAGSHGAILIEGQSNIRQVD